MVSRRVISLLEPEPATTYKADAVVIGGVDHVDVTAEIADNPFIDNDVGGVPKNSFVDRNHPY